MSTRRRVRLQPPATINQGLAAMQALFVSSGATQGQHQRRSRPSRAAGEFIIPRASRPHQPPRPLSWLGECSRKYAGADARRGLYEVNRDRRMVIARIARFDVQRRRCEKESGAGGPPAVDAQDPVECSCICARRRRRTRCGILHRRRGIVCSIRPHHCGTEERLREALVRYGLRTRRERARAG